MSSAVYCAGFCEIASNPSRVERFPSESNRSSSSRSSPGRCFAFLEISAICKSSRRAVSGRSETKRIGALHTIVFVVIVVVVVFVAAAAAAIVVGDEDVVPRLLHPTTRLTCETVENSERGTESGGGTLSFGLTEFRGAVRDCSGFRTDK